MTDDIKTQNLTDNAVIQRNMTALEKRYLKPEGIISNLDIFYNL
jgi:hypothetical protein